MLWKTCMFTCMSCECSMHCMWHALATCMQYACSIMLHVCIMHEVLRLVHIFFACIVLQPEVYTKWFGHVYATLEWNFFLFLRRNRRPNHFMYTSSCNVTQAKKMWICFYATCSKHSGYIIQHAGHVIQHAGHVIQHACHVIHRVYCIVYYFIILLRFWLVIISAGQQQLLSSLFAILELISMPCQSGEAFISNSEGNFKMCNILLRMFLREVYRSSFILSLHKWSSRVCYLL